MARSAIATVVVVEWRRSVWITTVVDTDGNVLTGVGNDYQAGEPILTYFDDRYNRAKFFRPHDAAKEMPNETSRSLT